MRYHRDISHISKGSVVRMAKQVLVIGGSYFVGRVFSILCSRDEDFELHVVNRGKAPIRKEDQGIHEYRSDRHDIDNLVSVIPDIAFDAVVDTCAYTPGEIAPIVEALHDRIGQYVYISTSSVYVPGDRGVKKEGDPILYESDDDMVAQYICNKALLEDELKNACGPYSIPWTIVRPAFIYGPFNYAPRESWFIEKIAHGKPVERLVDGTARFSFVYVTDVAAALQAFVGDERAFNETFNLSAPEEITNERFFDKLVELAEQPFATVDVTVKEVLERNIAIPWPLTDDELCDGTKFAETFGFAYSTFDEGMAKTFKSFMNVYR